jgi:nicotinamidase-related amidase
MNTKLLVIDPQNDFCDIPGAALPVSGADADMKRLAAFIGSYGHRLSGITVTLDSHASVAVERTTFWKKGDGGDVPAFTEVSAEDVRERRYLPRNESLTDQVIGMLGRLEAGNRYKLMVWPVHCVTGTWGHNIHTDVANSLARWEFRQQASVRKVLKGEYLLSEHYGVFEAEVPFEDEESTQFNHRLAASLIRDTDLLLVAGEASSHCVSASVEQLLRFVGRQQEQTPRIVLLSDCMSPVAGFEAGERAFFEHAEAHGVQRMPVEAVIPLLRSSAQNGIRRVASKL